MSDVSQVDMGFQAMTNLNRFAYLVKKQLSNRYQIHPTVRK